MRNSNLKNKISFTLFALALSLVAKSAMAVTTLDSNDYIRVTVPEASLADSRLVYGIDDQKVEATFQDGDVVELHAEQNDFLGFFSFKTYQEASNMNFEFTGTDPIGYDMFIHFSATNESGAINAEVPLVLDAKDAKVEVIQVSANPQDELGLAPTVLGEDLKNFKMEGVLEIRFVVKPAEQNTDGEANQDENNGDGQGNIEGDGNAASGGCSMIPGAAGSQASMILAGLALTLPIALRRKK